MTNEPQQGDNSLLQQDGNQENRMHWPYPAGFAHRLGGALAPENTLAGLLLSHRLGVSGVECDVQLSADGKAVIAHDAELERCTTGNGPLGAQTLAALQQLDAGRYFHPAFAGETMPSLAQLATRCRKLGMAVNLELKPAGDDAAMARQCVAEIAALWQGAALPPLLSSFSLPALAAAQQAAPQLPRALLLTQLSDEAVAQALALGCRAVHVYHRALTAEWVANLHQQSLAVMAWTVNRSEDMQRLRQWGVDMLCTDRPDRLEPGWA
ncbi:glycerophosphodiester phosphodiesterase [Vogesella oryzae]|uniref:glycerophosphodiester phosphodiesterase n=1 Tax=Vogesella oryzae TaxID=1735285 RepID=UPI001FE43741|nr:glycerophosphodiester phosphodiesterase [Vogesella oryzae]